MKDSEEEAAGIENGKDQSQPLKKPAKFKCDPLCSSNKEEPDIWVTMGLCWSNNTHYWGKDKFPYKEAAPMSSKLWMKLTGARWVICEFGARSHN